MPAIAPHSSSTTDAAWNAGTNDMVSDGGQPGAANTAACSTVIAILNGARGGADIPAGDKQAVYDHVARHLKAAGKEPAPLGGTVEETLRWALSEGDMTPNTARWLLGVDTPADDEEAKPMSEREGEHHTETTTGALPPVLPLGRKGWAIRDGLLGDLRRAATDAQANLAATRLMAASVSQAASQRLAATGQRSAGAVAVIPLCGIVTPRGSLLSMLFGGGRGGLAQLRDDFTDAITSPEIGAVVLDIDSPGGLVDLVPETAAMIRAARGQGKAIKAVVNTQACSAAYWLAAQADEIIASPSSELGSVGVYMLHLDYSGMNERLGVDPTYVKVPPAKTEGNPDEPLSDDAQAEWQRDVDDLYAMFIADVAAGRNVSAETVQAKYGEGRALSAKRGLEAGMCDRIGTLEQVVGELLGAPAGAEDPDVVSAEARMGRAADALEAAAERIADAINGRHADADPDDEDEDEDEPVSPDDDEDDEDDLPAGEPAVEEQTDAAARRAALLFD